LDERLFRYNDYGRNAFPTGGIKPFSAAIGVWVAEDLLPTARRELERDIEISIESGSGTDSPLPTATEGHMAPQVQAEVSRPAA
jgi:hypothetical protein